MIWRELMFPPPHPCSPLPVHLQKHGPIWLMQNDITKPVRTCIYDLHVCMQVQFHTDNPCTTQSSVTVSVLTIQQTPTSSLFSIFSHVVGQSTSFLKRSPKLWIELNVSTILRLLPVKRKSIIMFNTSLGSWSKPGPFLVLVFSSVGLACELSSLSRFSTRRIFSRPKSRNRSNSLFRRREKSRRKLCRLLELNCACVYSKKFA